MSERKIKVSLATMESHNHIIDDMERGVKIYERGGVEIMENEPGLYIARVPHKSEFKTVSVRFTRDGQDIEHHHCDCTWKYNEPPICRHVVAAVFAIQGYIPESKIELGKKYRIEHCVKYEDTAKVVGSGGLEVLATPRLIALMECAAYTLLEDALEDGQTSVGTNINIVHTAASPVGIMIEVEAEITSVRGRTITFEISANDEGGEIAKGTHTRVIVDVEKAKRKFPAERFDGKDYE